MRVVMAHATVCRFILHSSIASLGTIHGGDGGYTGEDINAVTDIISTIHAVQHITEPVQLFFVINAHTYNTDLILQPCVRNALLGGIDICRIIVQPDNPQVLGPDQIGTTKERATRPNTNIKNCGAIVQPRQDSAIPHLRHVQNDHIVNFGGNFPEEPNQASVVSPAVQGQDETGRYRGQSGRRCERERGGASPARFGVYH
mmetsp:Transcript_25398/g.73486  ORF Transcript_25398/g.73486 Transcript_25398/m.73486 type:complete len:201 (-) Transcript_25398:12-614(-)